MWMGACILMNLGASSGQIIVIPVYTAVGAEVSIHTLGAIGMRIVALLVFLICSEHLFSISALFFAYIAAIWWTGKWLKRCVNTAKLSVSLLTCTEQLF